MQSNRWIILQPVILISRHQRQIVQLLFLQVKWSIIIPHILQEFGINTEM